jgi:signal transduction histidine kinase
MATGNTINQRSFAPVPAPYTPVPGRHDVQFYSDDRFLLDSLVPFITKSLASGGASIVVATKAHRDGLFQRLLASGIRLAAAVQEGRYISLDAAETMSGFMKEGLPDQQQFTKVIGGTIARATAAVRGGPTQIAIFGEMVALLWQQGNAQGAIELERLWNDLGQSHSFDLRCGYPLTDFDREEHRDSFAKICGHHHAVIPAESYTALADESDRLRAIARLQQTEQALKTESSERERAKALSAEVQTQNQELIEEVRRHESAEEELRRFTRRLLMARDEEQRHVASELHENTAQLLAALSMYFGVLQEEKASLSPRAAAVVANSRDVAQKLLREVRNLSYLLHPPTLNAMGIGPALREYLDQFAECNKVRVALHLSDNLGRFSRNIEIAVFRIVEEALDNASHSGSLETTIRLARSSDDVVLEIHDRGAGILGDKVGSGAGRGVTGMVERVQELGGTVAIRSDGQGTLISLTLPIESPHSAITHDPSV